MCLFSFNYVLQPDSAPLEYKNKFESSFYLLYNQLSQLTGFYNFNPLPL
jgi:hypothetical protein